MKLADLLLGGPGHDGYASNADVYCVDCGQDIIRRLHADGAYADGDSGDTDEFPQPIFFGESPDCAQCCADCGEHLYGPETDETDDSECSECGAELDKDCFGNMRCPDCDAPCPGCSDGGFDDSEPSEPQDDDYTTEDHIRFYQNGKLAFTVRADGDHVAALRAHMEQEQFWPNAWFISDHGNAHLIDLG